MNSSRLQATKRCGDELLEHGFARVQRLMGRSEQRVETKQEEHGAVKGVNFPIRLPFVARPLELLDQENDHRVIGPLVLRWPCRGEVESQKVFEQKVAEPLFQR